MSCQEYQEVETILQNPKFVQDLFHRLQNVLDACLKTHYGNQFARVINNDDFLLLLLQDIVAAHSDSPAESNTVCPRHTGESHTEGRYFQDNWHNPYNSLSPELARLNTLFLNDSPSPISRAEIVQQVIANVDQQLPEDTTMSDPHSQDQPQQQQRQQAQTPASLSPEIYKANTAPSGSPQTQQMGAQQPFCLARAEFNQQNSRQPSGNHTSDSGESSGAQSDISFASGRKPGGKRVAGRWTCPVEDCPKRNEPMQKCRLEDHMARHEPNRRTQCPSCGKVYMHSRTCNEHHKKAHGMELKKWYELRADQFTQQAASLGDLEGAFAEEEAMATATAT